MVWDFTITISKAGKIFSFSNSLIAPFSGLSPITKFLLNINGSSNIKHNQKNPENSAKNSSHSKRNDKRVEWNNFYTFELLKNSNRSWKFSCLLFLHLYTCSLVLSCHIFIKGKLLKALHLSFVKLWIIGEGKWICWILEELSHILCSLRGGGGIRIFQKKGQQRRGKKELLSFRTNPFKVQNIKCDISFKSSIAFKIPLQITL